MTVVDELEDAEDAEEEGELETIAEVAFETSEDV